MEFFHESSVISIGNSYSKPSSTLPAKDVTYHEFSHTLEYQHQEIAQANKKWIQNRATGTPKPLRSLIPGANYGSQEIAYPDNFISPYVGKKYKDDPGNDATEALSVGIQHFTDAQNMKKLYQKDPEHFYLTVGSIIEIQNKNRR